MGRSKNEAFSDQQNRIAELAKALAHPARLAILQYLAETKVCITGDISDELPLSRTTVNQHLTELKNAGLIQGHVDGVKVNYCLNPEKIKLLVQVAGDFFKNIDLETANQCG